MTILISNFPCLAARFFPREDCSICPLAPLFAYHWIWYSLIRQNVSSLMRQCSSMLFYFNQEGCCPQLQSYFAVSQWLLLEYLRHVPPATLPFYLHQSTYWSSSTMTECHKNTATAPLSACHEASKKRCQFRLIWAGVFSLSSHFALLLFLFPSQVVISCSHCALFVCTVTCCYLALRPVASKPVYLCAHPVITFSPYQLHSTFVFSSWYFGRFFQSCFLFVCHMAILVNPARSILFAHCAFDVALSLPCFPANWLPFAFFLIRPFNCFGFSCLL